MEFFVFSVADDQHSNKYQNKENNKDQLSSTKHKFVVL